MQAIVKVSHRLLILIQCSQRRIVIRTTLHMDKHIPVQRYNRTKCNLNIIAHLHLERRKKIQVDILCLNERLKNVIGEIKNRIKKGMINTVPQENQLNSKQIFSMKKHLIEKQEIIGTLEEK